MHFKCKLGRALGSPLHWLKEDMVEDLVNGNIKGLRLIIYETVEGVDIIKNIMETDSAMLKSGRYDVNGQWLLKEAIEALNEGKKVYFEKARN